MKITADTNLLVRAVTEDNNHQARLAQAALASADLVVLTTTALCELVWVLSHGYKKKAPQIAEAVRRLAYGGNVAVDWPATEAGLALLDAGGDFADGAICYEGSWLGAEEFLSFDKRAVRLLQRRGKAARLLT
jgi:predicted nucleic-acid-binding protein